MTWSDEKRILRPCLVWRIGIPDWIWYPILFYIRRLACIFVSGLHLRSGLHLPQIHRFQKPSTPHYSVSIINFLPYSPASLHAASSSTSARDRLILCFDLLDSCREVQAISSHLQPEVTLTRRMLRRGRSSSLLGPYIRMFDVFVWSSTANNVIVDFLAFLEMGGWDFTLLCQDDILCWLWLRQVDLHYFGDDNNIGGSCRKFDFFLM